MKILKQNDESYKQVSEIIYSGGVIAYATDTVYGLGCSPFSLSAILELNRLKGRGSDKKFILLVPADFDVESFVYVSEPARELMSRFWPGPLTLIFKAREDAAFHPSIIGEEGKISFRVPSEPNIRKMLEVTGPLISTSANLSGQPLLGSAAEIARVFPSLDCIVEGQASTLPSTIVDVSDGEPKLLREGVISCKQFPFKIKGCP
ncbi:MAG: L-threonylcarbamoyladenylate synthase [Firmicutes bacterium]|nr:L-threonylcarbamoyladenylate synthase [Bacillota bacterium]